MTIINLHLAPAKLSIVTDTASFDGAGRPRYMTSKICPIPHLNAVLASRGPSMHLFEVQRMLMETLAPGGIDGALPERVGRELRQIHEEWVRLYGAGMVAAGQGTAHDMGLFAWSGRRGAMVGWGYDAGSGYRPVAIPYGATLMPATLAEGRPRNIKVPDGLIAFAKLQHRGIMARDGWGVGGELILFEMTRHRMELRKVHRFPDYDQVLAAMEKVNAEG